MYWLHFPRTLIEPRQAEIRKECLRLWGVSVPPPSFAPGQGSFREDWDRLPAWPAPTALKSWTSQHCRELLHWLFHS